MIIGIPKEIMHDEARVAATPETVGKFVQEGFEVLVENHAGDGALYHDEDYIKAGAKMVADPEEIYNRAEMILKVKEPLMNEAKKKHEVDMMHKGQILITFIHPASPVNHEMVKALTAKGVTAITLDGIPRISRAQNMDALTSMSTCAGYKGILMAASLLTTFIPQMFTAVGQIKPAKVMVIGVGVAGLQALATAKRLGAITYAADIRPMAAENAGSLGAKVVDTTVLEGKVKVRLYIDDPKDGSDDPSEKLSTDVYTFTKDEIRRINKRFKKKPDDIFKGVDAEELKELEKIIQD